MNLNWIEINKKELCSNLEKIKKAYGGSQNMGVMLKANAYGHGFLEIAICIKDIINIFYTTSVKDALILKKFFEKNNLEKRVVCVGSLTEKEAIKLTEKEVEFSLLDNSFIYWKKENFFKRPKIHIFIDTGLSREGIMWNSFDSIEKINSSPLNFNIIGLMTHFNNAEHAGPPKYAIQQYERFITTHNYLRKLNIIVEQHLAASVPSLIFPEARKDITRLGILMYGYWTSMESKFICKEIYKKKFPDVKPVLSWKAISKNIKIIPKGDFIGYDCAYLCQKETRIATINVGYYDGYPYLFNSNAWVLVKGERCPIVGNVMMNNMVIDISNIKLEENENEILVTLLGESERESIDADCLARWARITNYDILSGIKAHVKRIIK